MTTYSPRTQAEVRLLRRASRLWGLQTEFTNAEKTVTSSPHEALLEILGLLSGENVKTEADLLKLCERTWDEKFSQVLEPAYVIEAGQEFAIHGFLFEASIREKISPKVTLWLDDGTRLNPESVKLIKGSLRAKGQKKALRFKLQVKAKLPVGYHRLEFEYGEVHKEAYLYSAPARLKELSQKQWGLFTPLYAISNERNWGMGDLTDLRSLQDYSSKQGASFLGTLPMLAAKLGEVDSDPSPYSPESRLFWNEVYLDVETLLEESQNLEALNLRKSLDEEIEKLRDESQVNHTAVFLLKKKVLAVLARDFFNRGEDKLETFKNFTQNTPHILEYSKSRSGGDQVENQYHLYVQFKMDQALQKMSGPGRDSQKTAGLYLDFPVGVSASGFDAEKFSESFLKGASAGAPPDLVFPGGQNWGFEPLHPKSIRKNSYDYLIKCLRHHMRHASILRLDHVMGFHRMYVVPKSLDAKRGAYVRYRRDELFAILKIEASRENVTVVGEDLGTVPDEVRKDLVNSGALRMWVLPFEAELKPQAAIAKAPRQSLACLNTHDMIPFAGFEDALDIKLYKKLGLVSEEHAAQDLLSRQKQVKAWLKDLNLKSSEKLFIKLIEQLAKSPAQLFLLNIEDLWGETEAQNVPGTWKENPNWRKRWRYSFDEWSNRDDVNSVFDLLRELRPEHRTRPVIHNKKEVLVGNAKTSLN